MWKVSDVEPVRGSGRGRLSIWLGNTLSQEDGKPVAARLPYASRALAEAAATHLESALLNAISNRPTQVKRRVQTQLAVRVSKANQKIVML